MTQEQIAEILKTGQQGMVAVGGDRQNALRWFEEHYWDSLEQHKEMILLHIRSCPYLQ
jgi:hypothetical protein